MILCAGMLGIFLAILSESVALQPPLKLDNSLTRIEDSFNRDFPSMGAPIHFARTKVRDYFPAPNEKPGWGFLPNAFPRRTTCFPAAGKDICGVVDLQNHMLALTHHGCCEQDTLTRYDGMGLGLSTVNLSAVRTHRGIGLGSTSAAIVAIFGTPKVYHGVRTGHTAYAYLYRSPSGCPYYSMLFVFDRAQRVDALEYGFGC